MSRAVKAAEFARILDVSRSTVTRAKQAGRLVLDDSGRILVEESLQRYHATAGGRTDVAERHAADRGAELPAPPGSEPTESAEAEQEPEEALPESRKAYKAQVLHFENQNIRLEQALRRNERYPRKAVRREANALGGALRAAMERLVDETTPRLTIAPEAERRRLLAEHARGLRRILKSEMARALYRLRNNRE